MRRSLILNVVLILLTAACGGSQQAVTRPEPAPAAASDEQFLLTYPNLANPGGEVLLENELVVVQRFVVGPGEWEGIHSHPGNQVFVHVKGGQWSGRRGGGEATSGAAREDGSVGWMEPIALSEGHESGNTGDAPIDLIWVTLKKDGPVAAADTQFVLTYPLAGRRQRPSLRWRPRRRHARCRRPYRRRPVEVRHQRVMGSGLCRHLR